jgi:hypothetical protein
LIEQLQNDAAGIDQQYTGVKEQIKQGRVQPRLKRADVKAQTDKVAQIRLQVGQVALAQFQNRNLDTAAHLFVTPDTEGFVSQIPTVQEVTENQNSLLQDDQQAQANLVALGHSSETDLATLVEKEKQCDSAGVPASFAQPDQWQRQESQSASVRESAARGSLRAQWRRAELVGLLGPHDEGLAICRGELAHSSTQQFSLVGG